MADYRLIHGDALDVLRGMADNSVDAIVCDPPAGINFMQKSFDSDRGGRTQWVAWLAAIMAEAMRVIKPGGHALIWALPKKSHWTALALEDAGWEVRERISHIFGSGFPKSQDVGKAIDKAAGAEREVVGVDEVAKSKALKNKFDQFDAINPSVKGVNSRQFAENAGLITAPATDAAKEWDGWGTALKPSVEDWWLCRKPLSEPSIAANVLRHGVGGLNIDACRVAGVKGIPASPRRAEQGAAYGDLSNDPGTGSGWDKNIGRFPSHLLLSHHPSCIRRGEKRVKGIRGGNSTNIGGYEWQDVDESKRGVSCGYADADGRELVADWECDEACPVRRLDEQAGVRKSGGRIRTKTNGSAIFGNGHSDDMVGREEGYYDAGNASRFFTVFEPDPDALFVYAPKASRRDREEGLDLLEARPGRPLGISQWEGQTNGSGKPMGPSSPAKNTHPTVKSTSLMRWLCRLITPPGGTVLDMFMGSGSTGCAALLENFSFIGIEQELEYFKICEARLAWAASQRPKAEQLTLTV